MCRDASQYARNTGLWKYSRRAAYSSSRVTRPAWCTWYRYTYQALA